MSDYVQLMGDVRHPGRIRSSDLISLMIEDFVPLDSPDPALVAGTGQLGNRQVLILAQQKPKGRSAKGAAAVNHGMMAAVGYWYVTRQLELAAMQGLPVVTLIDTPGADPSIGGVERLLAWAISGCIAAFLTSRAPTVSVIIGEGGSGGALALQVADHRLMVSDAYYSVISPESCSAILFRDGREVSRALTLLRPGAGDALRIGMIDEIVPWPDQVAMLDHARAAALLKERLVSALDRLEPVLSGERLRRRREAQLSLGRLKEDPAVVAARPVAPRPRTVEPLPKRMTVVSGTVASPTAQLKCPASDGGCDSVFALQAFREARYACPVCGRGERLTSDQWIDVLCDPGSFEELYAELELADLDESGFNSASYQQVRQRAAQESGVRESLRIGRAQIEGHPCALAVCEFRYLGGTLGAVAGEKLRLLCLVARRERLPLVVLTCSGGARVYEGALALGQMAKSNAAIAQLRDDQLPYISILADPCTGGALASYATYATVVLAEPQALVAFAGPRVMRLHGMAVDERKLTSNVLAQNGGIDEIVPRHRLRARVRRYLDLVGGTRDRRGLAGTLMPGEMPSRDISRWFSQFISRIAAVFEGHAEGTDSVESDPMGSPFVLSSMVVAHLTDFALVTVPSLLELAANSPDPRVRANAVESLSRFPLLDSSQLIHALSDPHHRVRVSGAMGLLARDTETELALKAVRDLMGSADPLERRTGLFAATRFPLDELRATVEALGSDIDPMVRLSAGVALFSLRDVKAARRHLLDAVEELGTEAISTAQRWLVHMPTGARDGLRRFLKELSAEKD